MANTDNYSLLIGKLDEFIRKYYKNQLIKGLIYAFALLILFFIGATGFEYFAHLDPTWRTLLFYAFIAASIYVIGKLIILPLFRLYRLSSIISHETAAIIIGRHFSNVQDKLLNILQLRKMEELKAGHSDLIQASINQKIIELNPVPFSSAIDLGSNKRYLRYLALPLVLLFILLFTAPSLIQDGAKRLVNHRQYFERPAPFQFNIINEELSVVQQEDFRLKVKIEGEEIPEKVFLQTEYGQFTMVRESTVDFYFDFRNVQKSTDFRLSADGFSSSSYTLNALPNPLVLNFKVNLVYPAYLKKPSEELGNTGDMIIPAGTSVEWEFMTRNTEKLVMAFADTVLIPQRSDEDQFRLKRRFLRHNNYSFVSSNEFLKSKDSILYAIHVIPDLYPTISVEQQRDSFSTRQIFFKGLIKDDYGFRNLKFTYKFVNSPDALAKTDEVFSEDIKINKSVNQEQFFYYWDLNQIKIEPGDYLEYYFEVWDNDAVNGSKSAKTEAAIFKAPSLKELALESENRSDNLKKDLEETIAKSKEIQKSIDEAARNLIDKKELNYDDRKRIEELLKQHKEMEQVLKDVQNQNQKNQQMQQEYKKYSPEVLEKQNMLQELFEKLMSEEMKEKIEELEKLLGEMDKEKMQDMFEKLKFDEEALEKEMDRTLELFKQLEMEQKINELTENIDKLAEEQEELAQKSDEGKEESDKLKEEQDKLNEKFDELQKELDDIEKENEELEFPAELSDTEEDQQSIEEEMQKSSGELDKNKKEKAAQSQKKAAQEMKQMAQKMKDAMAAGAQEQMSEDLEALRALLENLIKFSFDQEELMSDLKDVNVNDPKYVTLSQTQRKLKDDAQVLKDSLYALSRRVIQIQSMVNREIAAINGNIESSIELLQERQKAKARSEQQYVMTSVNNLALMLSEAMEQMQQELAEGMPGAQQCSKPGAKPGSSAGQMKKLQQQLNKQIEALKKEMEQGKGKGKGKQGEGGMSEQLARLAAQQEAIRNEMQKLNQLQNKDGKGQLGNLDELAKQMEETETDLVNRRITQETLNRQKEILTRLLEAEKAERERELDNKRESAEPDQLSIKSPSNFEEYKKLKMREVELLKTIPPTLNPFYKNLVNYYFQSLDNN